MVPDLQTLDVNTFLFSPPWCGCIFHNIACLKKGGTDLDFEGSFEKT